MHGDIRLMLTQNIRSTEIQLECHININLFGIADRKRCICSNLNSTHLGSNKGILRFDV